MRISLVALFLGMLSWSAASADQKTEGTSPRGDISFELRDAGDEPKRIWLYPTDRKAEAVELCETPGWGNLEVHFSPDSSSIIVQDGGSSLGISLRLFRREKGVRFREIEAADIDGKAERLALQQHGLPAKEVSDHRYARVLAWSADSKNVLVSVSGRGTNLEIRQWTGLYDVGSGTFGFDLKKMNAGAVGRPTD